MTQVIVDSQRFENGPRAQSRGMMTCGPYKEVIVDGAIVTPASFSVAYPGEPVLLELEQLPAGNAWKTRLEVDGLVIEKLVAPVGAGPVQWADLPIIDPETMAPTEEPEAEWWAIIGQLDTDLGEQVVGGVVVGDDLVLHQKDGGTIDAGNVRGPVGAQGVKGDTGNTGAQGLKGDIGNTGPQGNPGATGNTGATPNVQIGTVLPGAAAATMGGTPTNPLLNLTIPTGTLSGTGSPEGVVTAGVGALYVDISITTGAFMWAKKSGTGNTGWKVVDGDTGNRDMLASTALALVAPQSTSSYLHLSRIGTMCYLSGRLVADPAGALIGVPLGNQMQLFAFPTGFQPADAFKVHGQAQLHPSTTSSGYLMNVSTGGRLDAQLVGATGNWAAATVVSVQGSWRTAAAWPTTLP